MQLKRRNQTLFIVIHCSYTPSTMDIGVEEIDRWHRDRGWHSCGYHYVIRRDGTIEHGRPRDTIGAHVRGFNEMSLGICLIGGMSKGRTPKDEDNFTFQQGVALHELLQQIRQKYTQAQVVGHNELDSSRTCPVVNLDLIKRYNNEIAEHDVTRSGHDD